MIEIYHYHEAEITIDTEKPTTTVVIHHPGGQLSKPIVYNFNLIEIKVEQLSNMYAEYQAYTYLFLLNAKREMVKQ